jgi:replicative DNA helicase
MSNDSQQSQFSSHRGDGAPFNIDPDVSDGPFYPISKMNGRGSSRSCQPGYDGGPPRNLAAEQNLIGAILLDPGVIPAITEVLSRCETPFYARRHADIWGAVCRLNDRGDGIDLSTVAAELQKMGADVASSYLADCTDSIGTTTDAERLARVVVEEAVKRRLFRLSGDIHQKARDETTDVFDLMDEAERSMMDISAAVHGEGGPTSSRDTVQETIRYLESIHGSEGGITGVPSGLRSLDAITAGWQDGDLIILAGRPSMGKTSCALSMIEKAAEGAAGKDPVGAAIFSLEMGRKVLMQRLISGRARVDFQRMRKGQMTDEEWMRVSRAGSALADLPIYIDDTPNLTPLELKAKARRLKSEHDVGLICVDYLGLMEVGAAGTEAQRITTKEQAVAHISRSLKGLAKELDLPVLALHQMNRAVENRGGDKRPQLSDLRNSGQIEQDADVVTFVYRAERYGISQDAAGRDTDGVAELIVEKQRNGPIGTARVAFVKEFARFENLSAREETDAHVGSEANPF